MEKYSEKYFEQEPWSFGSKKRIKENLPHLRDKEISNFLYKNDIYTRFRQHKTTKKYSPIYVYNKRELFQADVVFFTDKDMVKENLGYRYLFTCIDCFSKIAWVYPLKLNNCDTVMKCFQDILSKCGKKPDRLNSDRGSELICKKFEKFLSDEKIFHYLSYSDRKCPIIERFNLTFQNIIYKMMAYNRTLKWTSFVEKALTIYNNRIHSTIKMTPLEAEKDENEIEVRKNLLTYFHKRGGKRKKPKFALNNSVRIWKKRGTFHRGYDENFSQEYFKINDVKTNLPVPRYQLIDSKGEIITGSFFEDELVRYEPKDVFDIEIINQRKKGKRLEYLIHYHGYPKSMDEWVPKKRLIYL